MAPRPRLTARVAAALTATVALLLGCAAATASRSGVGTRSARTYVVNSTADRADADVGVGRCADSHKKCTLRAAIMQANFHPGPDTVKIPAGTYTLTRKGDDDQDVLGDLDVTDSLTLEGAGSVKTVINGNGKVTQDRVLQVMPTATDTTITGLTIRGGRLPAVFSTGGGLLWNGGDGGQLTVTHVVVSHNSSYDAGGMALLYAGGQFSGGSVRLDHVVAERNSATAAVGGIDATVGSLGEFVIRDSLVHANKAYEAAGLYLQGPSSGPDAASIGVESTVFSDNHAPGLSGGLEIRGGSKTALVTVTTSWFHDNTAGFQGGAIGHFFGDLEVTRSTLEGNTSMKGGALYDYEGALATITNTALSHNSASDTGGGVYVEFFNNGLADVRLVNSTLSGNAAPTGGGMYISPGAEGGMSNTLLAHGSEGANCVGNLGGQTSLSDDNSCGFGAGADGIDLLLGTIGWHGGPTRSLLPQVGSPALDIGTVAGEPLVDQRGISRPMGTGIDIGSVEVCPLKPAAPTRVHATQKAKSRRLELHWTASGCWETFTVVVRHNSPSGKVVETKKHLVVPTLETRKLTRGRMYTWRVTIVGDRGDTASTWHHIKVR